MGGVSASVELLGSAELQRRFARASTTMQKKLVDEVAKSSRPMLNDMRGEAVSPIEKRAMGSVEIRKEQNGIELSGGRGGGLEAKLFMGGEFGGRSSKKRLVYGSVYGRPVTRVFRRATMMFKVHLGKEGHFFWPAVREWLPKLHTEIQARALEVLGGR